MKVLGKTSLVRSPWLGRACAILIAVPLASCSGPVLDPVGDVAVQQRDLLYITTLLMLLVAIPVLVMTVLFAWRYRHDNTEATYTPDWDHSAKLELVIWAVPLLIVICIGALTWVGTHLLDPFRPLNRISVTEPIRPWNKPVRVQVVALDWKWLFIYPDEGIATVNDLAVPVNRPIEFSLTSSTVMNSFYVPTLAGQIYAMPGMETKLHAVANRPTESQGFSANYSGAGFSGMHFAVHAVDTSAYENWVNEAKASGTPLDRAAYMQLELRSENDPVRRFGSVENGLFNVIVEQCVTPGKMCMGAMSEIDRRGGLGLAAANATLPYVLDGVTRKPAVLSSAVPSYVSNMCAPDQMLPRVTKAQDFLPVRSREPLRGAGLVPPDAALIDVLAGRAPLSRKPSDS